MLDGRLKDDDPPAWYEGARTVALTCATNEAFQLLKATAMSTPPFTSICRAGESQTKFAAPLVTRPAAVPTPTASSGPAPKDVDATKRRFSQPLSCRHCGKVGHFTQEFPQAYDICFITAEEQEELLEHWMVAADVRDVADEKEVERDDSEDFVSCSE